MSGDSPRQGRPHTVVITVQIGYALHAHDALAAALAGGGQIVRAVVSDAADGDHHEQDLSAAVPHASH